MHNLDPRLHWHLHNNIYSWRLFLKKQLLKERKGLSDLSGQRLWACEMHEGILSRANVPKSIWWHYYIYHPYNCFLLLPEEHRPHSPSREWAIHKAFERYGKEKVVRWFNGLPFKVKPFVIDNY